MLAEDAPYQDVIQFEPSQAADMFGTFVAEQTLSEVPIFGPGDGNVEARLVSALQNSPAMSAKAEQLDKMAAPLPDAFHTATSVAQKLRLLRAFVRRETEAADTLGGRGANHLDGGPNDISLASNSLGTCLDIHEGLLTTLAAARGLPREAQSVVDHAMLLRAKERYLFDAAENRSIIGDDPWKRFVWDWIAGTP